MPRNAMPPDAMIGIIASESSETGAHVILREGEEKNVEAEDLVLVDNRNGGSIMAVLRRGRGTNENLKPGGYHPGVAYARIGGQPSTAKETYDFELSVIGEVGSGVQQNKKILAPGSDVYVFNKTGKDPMSYLHGGQLKHTIGHYEGHPEWLVPVDVSFIQYHVGIFASTGGGKSFLARYELIPLLMEAGYDVLVLDWKGRDYAPYYPKDQVLSITDLAADADTVAAYLARKMRNFGYSASGGSVYQAVEAFVHGESWRGLQPKEFRRVLEVSVVEELNPKRTQSGRPYEDEQRFLRGMRHLRDQDIKSILGTIKPEDTLREVRSKATLVIDMKRTGKDEKLSMFLTLANYLMEQMQADLDLNLALLIDEGPQYCPFKPVGMQEETTDVIIDLCALGRSHKLCITLLSQGIAGEIGINAAVRRNLNTQFMGKIHPLDMAEASNWLMPFNIDPRFLLSLPPGHFYFMGNMNASPTPLLINFQIPGPS